MEQYLIDYYYYFLHERHYFECHEIMEDAWKMRPSYHKNDIEVAFIMLATAQYHDRRSNKKGAARCLSKSLNLFISHQSSLAAVGLTDAIIPLLSNRLQAIALPYQPLQLPLTEQCLVEIKASYPSFNPLNTPSDEVIDYHATRDRSEIIQLRLQRLMDNKYPVDNSPDDGH